MSDWNGALVRKALLGEISSRLAPHGYVGPKGQSFHRKCPGGRVSFHVAFIGRALEFDVTADVAARNDALEECLNRQNSKPSAAQARDTSSIGAELGRIRGGGQMRWTVRSIDDVPRVAAAIVQEFEAVGQPYLDRYSSLESMLSVLQRNDAEGWLHSPIHLKRCKSAVCAAHLLGRADLVEVLIQSGKEFLRAQKDWGLPAFLDFAEWIRSVRANAKHG